MYFINYKALSADLHKNTLTEKEKFKYFFAFFVLTAVGESFVDIPIKDLIDFLSRLVVFMITIATPLVSYVVNTAGDGKNFIERFIVLQWVIALRTLLISIPLLLLLITVTVLIEVLITDSSFKIDSLKIDLAAKLMIGFIVSGFYFYFMVKSFLIVSGHRKKKK